MRMNTASGTAFVVLTVLCVFVLDHRLLFSGASAFSTVSSHSPLSSTTQSPLDSHCSIAIVSTRGGATKLPLSPTSLALAATSSQADNNNNNDGYNHHLGTATNSMNGGSHNNDTDTRNANERTKQYKSTTITLRQRLINALPGRPATTIGSISTTTTTDIGSNNAASTSLDTLILKTALPAMANLAIVPIVSSFETVWIGRMGIALALAGQSAANAAFLTSFFLISFLPTMTAPLVAGAIGAGNKEEARQRISETLFLCNVMGTIGTLFISCYPRVLLQLVIPNGAPAMEYAAPYLRWRALSMIPELVSATGFASFRGMLDTVTPLKISCASSLIKTILDPILLFFTPLGFIGPPFATLTAELMAGMVNLRLLLKNKLVNLRRLIKPPTLKDIAPLLSGGAIMLVRQMAINVGLLYSGRCAQSIDPSGVAAAAYGIVNQMYTIGFVVHVAMQGAAAALVPSKLAQTGVDGARQMADRLYAWSLVVGLSLGFIQFLALTFLVPVFTTLPEVQKAVRMPAILASLLHVVNGPRFAGEGVLMGLCAFRDLTMITVTGISIMAAALSTSLGKSLTGIMACNLIFCSFQTVALTTHYLCFGRLASRRRERELEEEQLLLSKSGSYASMDTNASKISNGKGQQEYNNKKTMRQLPIIRDNMQQYQLELANVDIGPIIQRSGSSIDRYDSIDSNDSNY